MNLPNLENKEIFHAYDVRGLVTTQLNENVAYKIAHAYFALVPGQRFVIGYDMRESSPLIFKAFVRVANELGKTIDSLGMVTTDRVYFAVGRFDYDGGIMITASHNPEIWNGIKFAKKDVIPLDIFELKRKYEEQAVHAPSDLLEKEVVFSEKNIDAEYRDHILSFVDKSSIAELKIVIDAGNGMGGINAAKVLQEIPAIKTIEMYFEPNANFPHHEANPTISTNTIELSKKVISEQADLGVAFDGDGDRCLFVDEKGEYVPGHLAVALLTRLILSKNPGAKIAHEYKNVYAIKYEIERNGGVELAVQTGHSNFKRVMHEQGAVFGGESSAHYYFQSNYYADNGLIGMLLLVQMISNQKTSLSNLLSEYRNQFFSSGEMNFVLYDGVEFNAIETEFKQAFADANQTNPDGLVVEYPDWRFNARMSNTEPILRINIEAKSKLVLERSVIRIKDMLASKTFFIGNLSTSAMGYLQKTNQEKFNELIDNFWFTWNPHYILPIIDMYGDGWRKNIPPKAFMADYGVKQLDKIIENKSWEITESYRLFKDYADSSKVTWFDKYVSQDQYQKLKVLKQKPIAYFCMEYGLVDWLQIYSGGLGVLAGDYMKQVSDSGVPVVGVGLFYHQGYFHQDFSEDGAQTETYIYQDPIDYPFELVKDKLGNQLEVKIEIDGHDVFVRSWKLNIGRVNLYLLDTNFDKNSLPEDRMISAHLYGGDQDTRIRQEILLGIGGARLIEALEIEPSLYHMNEGHSGFLAFEVAKTIIRKKNVDFKEAIEEVDNKLIFTNHTLKQAGNDIFPFVLVEKYFASYSDDLGGVSIEDIFNQGRDERYAQREFSMTILGLRNGRISSAVSKLHGEVAKKIWPDYNLVPITNGVHMATWVSPEIHELLDRYVGENWHYPEFEVDYTKVQNIPSAELWEAHKIRKAKLINSLNRELGIVLDSEALTIAWSRRLAAYKRPDLIASDLERLDYLVNKLGRPIQILIAGKAHPRDGVGKELLQKMNHALSDVRFKNKVVLIPGYNWQLARRMVSGADIWLNTPYRFEEASGTSGMKAAANGIIQVTTKDGWTDEVEWLNVGWVVSEDDPAKSLHDTLEYQCVPLFFDRGAQEFNQNWVGMMRNSMELVLKHYSAQRMVADYLEKLYLPLV